jgi:aryl-alcohol dehydrogenase-like predicted oxidoreductase
LQRLKTGTIDLLHQRRVDPDVPIANAMSASRRA